MLKRLITTGLLLLALSGACATSRITTDGPEYWEPTDDYEFVDEAWVVGFWYNESKFLFHDFQLREGTTHWTESEMKTPFSKEGWTHFSMTEADVYVNGKRQKRSLKYIQKEGIHQLIWNMEKAYPKFEFIIIKKE